MSMRWYVLRRVLWTVVAAWLVLSATFLLFAYTPDPNESLVAFAAGPDEEAQEAAVSAYREARDRNKPIVDRYVDWVVGYATLNWGTSYSFSADRPPMPVTAVIVQTGAVTLTYLVPAIVLSLVVGVAVGLYSATHEYTVFDYLGTSFSYVGLGIPNFWLAEALVLVAVNDFAMYNVERWNPEGPLSAGNRGLIAIAGFVVAVNLLAVQVRYARSESKEFVPAEFVKTVRSTGASGFGVARHVLRNAAVPLISLLFTEVLVVVLINVYVVETVLGIQGLGQAAFVAMQDRDIGLVLGSTILVVFIALAGNLLQDLAYTVLDPRIDYEEG